MIEKYKTEHLAKNFQFVLVDKQGNVVESDNTLFNIDVDSQIQDWHPFFENFSDLLSSFKDKLHIDCVHLDSGNTQYITDIDFEKKPDGVLIKVHNLTSYYDNFQTMAQSRNESAIASELIIIKNKEFEERERFKNQFIQNFSHELRNPMMSMMSITNLLAKTDLTPSQKQLLEYVQEGNEHLKLLLEDILSISMISTGRLKLENKTFNLHKLFDLLRFTYANKAKANGLKFDAKIDARLPETAEGDRLRLYQVLTNLLDNALKYTDAGSITFTATLNQKWGNKMNVRFEISDTGKGISTENQKMIFESFSQLNHTNEKDGVGLGLAIVNGLVKLMGSEIKLTSEIDKGSMFYFDLNLKTPITQIKKAPLQKTIKSFAQKSKAAMEKQKILLVEDDERIQTILLKTLIDSGNYHVDIINDGGKVLEQVLDTDYDLIIMDVHLPNTTGNQLARLIRDFPIKKIKNVPIIGITADAFEDNIKGYLKDGMNTVLSKPFSDSQLTAAINKYIK
ncbi:MAG: response regulator [Croceitalea sp.]|nr:response regulator [Croceitalea sp.]